MPSRMKNRLVGSKFCCSMKNCVILIFYLLRLFDADYGHAFFNCHCVQFIDVELLVLGREAGDNFLDELFLAVCVISG